MANMGDMQSTMMKMLMGGGVPGVSFKEACRYLERAEEIHPGTCSVTVCACMSYVLIACSSQAGKKIW